MCRYWDLVWSAPGSKGIFDVYANTTFFCYYLDESFDIISPCQILNKDIFKSIHQLEFTIKVGVTGFYLTPEYKYKSAVQSPPFCLTVLLAILFP